MKKSTMAILAMSGMIASVNNKHFMPDVGDMDSLVSDFVAAKKRKENIKQIVGGTKKRQK